MRCFNSTRCIPLKKMCDGYSDCPHNDDEIACGTTCPPNCFCTGLVFLCDGIKWQPLTDAIFSSVRLLKIYKSIIDTSMRPFHNLYSLVILELSHNHIQDLNSELFLSQSNLQYLDVRGNGISKLRKGTFRGLGNARHVLLQNNPLAVIETSAFEGLINVTKLKLDKMEIRQLLGKTFYGLQNLRELNLSHNLISTITASTFEGLISLERLDISGNKIQQYSKESFSDLRLMFLQSDHYKFCCLAKMSKNACIPKPDEFSSCTAMMKIPALRISLWVIGFIATIGNVGVIVVKFKRKQSRVTGAPYLLITSLACSDLMMGVYMIIIAAVDMQYAETYIEHDEVWRGSTLCKTCGVLATMSSEVSAFMLLILTLDRFLFIGFPMKNWRLKKKSCRILIIFAWLSSAVVSIVPLVPIAYFGGQFYARSPTCVSLHITNEEYPGWEYSFGLFTVFNLCVFMAVGIMYGWMYAKIKQTGKFLGQNTRRTEITVARKMAAVIVTDLCCWIPVSVLGG